MSHARIHAHTHTQQQQQQQLHVQHSNSFVLSRNHRSACKKRMQQAGRRHIKKIMLRQGELKHHQVNIDCIQEHWADLK